jgi:RimJ/RimL family protein N-acetyltransferase
MRDRMIIETERLILREFRDEDIEFLAALMADPEVMRFSLRGPITDREKVKGFLQKIIDRYPDYGLYVAQLKGGNQPIGFVGLANQVIDGEDKVELGYRFFPAYWGKGYAQEGAKAVCQYSFEHFQIKELICIIEPTNVRSIALAKKIGMVYSHETLYYDIPVHIFYLPR